MNNLQQKLEKLLSREGVREFFLSHCKHLGDEIKAYVPIEFEIRTEQRVIQKCCKTIAVVDIAHVERLERALKAAMGLVEALTHGEPDYNSAWSKICLMAEGEGDDANVYRLMAQSVYCKLKPALDAFEKALNSSEPAPNKTNIDDQDVK